MKPTIRRLATRLAAVALLVGIVGVFGSGGPPPASAQTDTTVPSISSLTITSDTDDDDSSFDDDGVYGINDSIKVTVTFSENVVVTGKPQLELAIGSNDRAAAYESTNGSAVVFSYTVAEGDSDDDGIAISVNKLTLNGGTVKDAANNNATLSHDALTAQEGHQVDGVRPTISSVLFSSTEDGYDGVYTAGDVLHTAAWFSEEVVATGTPQLELDFEGTAKLADFDFAVPTCEANQHGIAFCAFTPGVRGNRLVFGYTVLTGESDSDGVAVGANAVSLNGGAIKDAAGNDAVLTHDAVAEDPDFVVAIGGL